MSQGDLLFGRAYQLEISAPGQIKAARFGNVGEEGAALRCAFEIDKDSTAASNKSKITLYNLGPALRQTITAGNLVRLTAGYFATRDIIFTGNVFAVHSERTSGDIATIMECGDGEAAIAFSKLNKAYAGPVPLYQILQDCAAAMNTPTDLNPEAVVAGVAMGIPNVKYQRFTAEGPVRTTLDSLLNPLGLEWSVQNGQLNILPVLAYAGGKAQLVAPSTGLINLPSVDKSITKFTSLLNPKLNPGTLVQLASLATELSGLYKVRSSKFVGDTHEPASWSVACEAATIDVADTPAAVSTSFNYDEAVD